MTISRLPIVKQLFYFFPAVEIPRTVQAPEEVEDLAPNGNYFFNLNRVETSEFILCF